MIKITSSISAAVLAAVTVAALTSFPHHSALALEPDRASDIIALFANHTGLVSDEEEFPCPYHDHAGAFRETGPDGTENSPFVVPPNMVFIATAFEWQGNGGLPGGAWERNVLAQGAVLGPPAGGTANARTRIRSSAIADVDETNEPFQVQAGNSMTMPTGVVFRPQDEESAICLLVQQLNDVKIGSGFLYGFLARDN